MGDFTYLPADNLHKPLRTQTAEAGTRQGRRNIAANLNQGSKTDSHKDQLSNRDEDDYPLTHTVFGNRETNTSFAKAPISTANNWFEMYN